MLTQPSLYKRSKTIFKHTKTVRMGYSYYIYYHIIFHFFSFSINVYMFQWSFKKSMLFLTLAKSAYYFWHAMSTTLITLPLFSFFFSNFFSIKSIIFDLDWFLWNEDFQHSSLFGDFRFFKENLLPSTEQKENLWLSRKWLI